MKTFRGLTAVMATAALLALGGCGTMVGSSGFVDEDRASEPADQGLMGSVMTGLGAVDTNRNPIKYQPRSPLAVPPDTADLPSPESANTVETATAEQWPTDPEARDRQARLRGSARERARAGRLDDGNPRMSVGELQEGAIEGGNARQDTSLSLRERQARDQDKPVRLNVYEMKNQRADIPTSTAPLDVNGVPKRQYLTQPPSTYRVPSPNAPVNPEEKEDNRGWWRDIIGPKG